MSKQEGPVLGRLIEGEAFRDAVHVAIAPVEAGQPLLPGDRVGLLEDGKAGYVAPEKQIGIVDPYLVSPVRIGQRFYLCLFPNTVTSLRHAWTHPAFRPKPPEVKHEQ